LKSVIGEMQAPVGAYVKENHSGKVATKTAFLAMAVDVISATDEGNGGEGFRLRHLHLQALEYEQILASNDQNR